MATTEVGSQLKYVDIKIIERELRDLVPSLASNQRIVARALLSRFGEILSPSEVHEQVQLMGMDLTYVQVKNALTGLLENVRKRLHRLDGGKP